MPEYVTVGNPATAVARKAISWLKDSQALDDNVQQLDFLAKQYACPGATDRAAEYIIDNLR